MLEILKNISGNPLFVIDKSIPITKYIPISIASSNSALTFDVSSSDEWEDYINNYLNKNDKKVAFGGYLEVRDIYNRSDYFSKLSEENQRNIHLGTDLWCDANTTVLVADYRIKFKNPLNKIVGIFFKIPMRNQQEGDIRRLKNKLEKA